MSTKQLLSTVEAAQSNKDLGPSTWLEFGPTVKSFQEVWWDVAVHLCDDTASLYMRADHIFGGYRWAIRADDQWAHVGNSPDPNTALQDGLARLHASR